ncbi:MAG: hypothetical protein V2I82_02145 [Halieaceae bacterium]|nr:hypothetical protein [Halieaceae bacterium]
MVVFLALAPLWHFMPTKSQRRQARLRECAALAGLFVELRDLPLPRARRERLPAVDRQLVYYGCRLRPGRGRPDERCAWFRESADGSGVRSAAGGVADEGQEARWGSLPARRDPPKEALEMPACVLAVDLGPDSCGVYWREEGDEDTVRMLAEKLRAWRDEITPQPV